MWRREAFVYPSHVDSEKHDYTHSCNPACCDDRQHSFTRARSRSRYDTLFGDRDFFPCSSRPFIAEHLPRSYRATEAGHIRDYIRPRERYTRMYEPVYNDDIDDLSHTFNRLDPWIPSDHGLGSENKCSATTRTQHDSMHSRPSRPTPSQTNENFRNLLNEAREQRNTAVPKMTPSQTNQYFRNLLNEAREQRSTAIPRMTPSQTNQYYRNMLNEARERENDAASKMTPSQTNQYYRNLLNEARAKKDSNRPLRSVHVSDEPLMSGARHPRDSLTDHERRNVGLVRDDLGTWMPEDRHRGRGRYRRGGMGSLSDETSSDGGGNWY